MYNIQGTILILVPSSSLSCLWRCRPIMKNNAMIMVSWIWWHLPSRRRVRNWSSGVWGRAWHANCRPQKLLQYWIWTEKKLFVSLKFAILQKYRTLQTRHLRRRNAPHVVILSIFSFTRDLLNCVFFNPFEAGIAIAISSWRANNMFFYEKEKIYRTLLVLINWASFTINFNISTDILFGWDFLNIEIISLNVLNLYILI